MMVLEKGAQAVVVTRVLSLGQVVLLVFHSCRKTERTLTFGLLTTGDDFA